MLRLKSVDGYTGDAEKAMDLLQILVEQCVNGGCFRRSLNYLSISLVVKQQRRRVITAEH